jgi:hypothetical protein
MALESQVRRIGEFDYKVTQLPARRANRVLLKIGKTVGPVLLMVGLARGEKLTEKLDTKGILDAIQGLDENDFEWVLDEFAKVTDVAIAENQNPTLFKIFDVHFAGKQGEMIEWLTFCVEVNFSFLVEGLRTRLSAKQKKDADAVTSAPATSASS